MDNNDIAGALGKLLEDPAALAKAMSIASSLMGSIPTGTGTSDAPRQANTNTAPALSDSVSGEPDSIGGASGENTPNVSEGMPSVAAIAQLLGGGGASKNDPRCALLYALKPYMGHGRDEKIDTLVNMLRLAQLAGGMFGEKPHGRE